MSFVSSVRLSIKGANKIDNEFIDLFTHPLWCITLFILVPMLIGEFGRGESSPVPWVHFLDAYSEHGLFNGIFALLSLIAVELWIFWIPAHVCIKSDLELTKDYRIILRLFNLSIGLLLVTYNNPIYRTLNYLSGQ